MISMSVASGSGGAASLSRAKKLFTVLFVCYPISAVYAVGPLNLGQVTMLPFIAAHIVLSFRSPFVARPLHAGLFPMLLCLFVLLLFVQSIVSSIVFATTVDIFRIAKGVLLIYGVLVVLAAGRFVDRLLAIKVLKAGLLAVCIVLCVQLAANALFGVQIMPYLPFLDTVSEEQTSRVLLYESGDSIIYRPASLFVEPSHFALFCGFGLWFLLFDDSCEKTRRDYALLLFVTLCMLASTSGTALVLAGVCWFMYFAPQPCRRPLVVMVAMLVAVVVIAVSLSGDGQLAVAFSRLNLMEGSGATRLFSFLEFYEDSGLGMKLLGCGIGNMSTAYSANMPFVSGDGILILESGFVGMAAFLLLMAYMVFADNRRLAPYGVLILLVGVFEQYLYGTYFAYSLVFPLYCLRRKA